MSRVREILSGLAAALSLVLAFSAPARCSTPKVDPFSSCSPPAGNFAVTIGFDATNNVPTVSASKNTACVMAGNMVGFQTESSAHITSWDVKFPTTTPIFSGSCGFGSVNTGSSQACTVVSNAGKGDYVYVVDVWINGGSTKYTLDPKVIIRDSGKRKRRHAADASAARKP
jgi:hypothetical protein